jgi:hypothetical protein
MARAYVVAGPCRVGNDFGYFGHEVPESKFLPVRDGEYANGGHGPSAVGPLFDSREAAEGWLAEPLREAFVAFVGGSSRAHVDRTEARDRDLGRRRVELLSDGRLMYASGMFASREEAEAFVAAVRRDHPGPD